MLAVPDTFPLRPRERSCSLRPPPPPTSRWPGPARPAPFRRSTFLLFAVSNSLLLQSAASGRRFAFANTPHRKTDQEHHLTWQITLASVISNCVGTTGFC